jgi:macrolide phosphotransferase
VACRRAGREPTYPERMARSHFTLAALATSAVDGLDVAGASAFGSGGQGDYDAALITARDGKHWIIRVPRSPAAEAEQSADLVALRALSTGVRARLPFAVTSYAGQTPAGATRAVVYEFVYGVKLALDRLDVDLADSLGRAIAAIHELPTSVVADAGLPVHSSIDAMRQALQVLGRATETGLVPAALQRRWERAASDSSLWQFTPTVLNGALSAASLLAAEGRITGLLGWQSLQVGDPARDLHWVLAAPGDGVADAVFTAYGRARGSVDRRLQHRARLLGELELAEWLLHGTATRSTEIVDDAVELMSHLVDDLAGDLREPITAPTPETLDVDEVERLLDQTPQDRRAG